MLKIRIWVFSLILLPLKLFSQSSTNHKIDSTYYQHTLENLSKGSNQARYKYLKSRIDSLNNSNITISTESVDYFGLYKNIIVEKKGKSDSIIYIISHYDKIGNNIISTVNSLVNGNMDIILSHMYLSKGAYDNGTGVTTSLALLDYYKDKSTHYTLRFLFTTMEEYGLRGARKHVAGIKKDEWEKVFCAINIDMVAYHNIEGISVSPNVSNTKLLSIADSICLKNDFKLQKSPLPKGGLADYYIFKGHNFFKDFSISLMTNVTGAIIPQKSYFCSKKSAKPIINFTDPINLKIPEMCSPISPIGFGKIHSYKDNIKIVSLKNLHVYHLFFIEYIEELNTCRLPLMEQ